MSIVLSEPAHFLGEESTWQVLLLSQEQTPAVRRNHRSLRLFGVKVARGLTYTHPHHHMYAELAYALQRCEHKSREPVVLGPTALIHGPMADKMLCSSQAPKGKQPQC